MHFNDVLCEVSTHAMKDSRFRLEETIVVNKNSENQGSIPHPPHNLPPNSPQEAIDRNFSDTNPRVAPTIVTSIFLSKPTSFPHFDLSRFDSF